jgi:hypothetical protein
MNIVTITLYIHLLDRVSIVLYNKYGPPNNHVPASARWFFIHAFTNMLICELGFPSLLFCLKNISTCSTVPVDTDGLHALYTAIILHLYHVVFFYPHLTYNDYIHHGFMLGISGPLCLMYPSRLVVMGLWFMSGFPGMIDYFLLWCVKMNWVDTMTEKYIYTLITMLVRSPGCLLSSFAAVPLLMNPSWTGGYVAMVLNAALTFWNGQYYAMLTCFDYGSKIERVKHKIDDKSTSECSK